MALVTRPPSSMHMNPKETHSLPYLHTCNILEVQTFITPHSLVLPSNRLTQPRQLFLSGITNDIMNDIEIEEKYDAPHAKNFDTSDGDDDDGIDSESNKTSEGYVDPMMILS